MRRVHERGVTLIDTVIGAALLLTVFLGIYGAFMLTVDVVTNNKARAAAIALANERMEYIRSLTYTQVGTSGGIPSGALAQTESIPYNGVNFTRRTFVGYADDPTDGSGGADSNGIIADYKIAKVDVYWTARTGERHITVVTRITPTSGVETSVSGGTLTIQVVNASGVAVQNAQIRIVNSTVSPAVDLTTYSNASGTASFIGTTAGSGYQITVSKTGYSTAQTYSATSENTSPNPGHLTVSNNQTTSATFAIDLLGSKVLRTYAQGSSTEWSDSFPDETKMGTSTNMEASGNRARFAGNQPWTAPGDLRSILISAGAGGTWGTFSWNDTRPSETTITYHVYYLDSSGAAVLVPDSTLPGNSGGFDGTSVNISGIPAATYPSLVLGAHLVALNPSAPSPSIEDWSVTYSYSSPISLAVGLRGAKTIGSGPSGTIYKYDESFTTNASGYLSIPSVEWDTYTYYVNGTTTNYDIYSSCAPQPESLSPGGSVETSLYLIAHTVNSLLVDVKSATTSQVLQNASVGLSRSGYAATSTTDSCGNAFFGGISSNSSYNIYVSKSGYQSYFVTGVAVGGSAKHSATLQ